MDYIGLIPVPVPTALDLTFPLISEMGYGTIRPFPTVTHRFGTEATKSAQTFNVGIGPRKFTFQRSRLSYTDRTSLINFWESCSGAYAQFTYLEPNSDQTTTSYQVIFDTQPLSLQEFVNACQTGITFVEVPNPADAPSYTVNSTCLRFPSDTLQTALQSEVQQIIPLVHISVRNAYSMSNLTGVPDIYVSDRRCTVGGQLYLPRLLNIGDPGSDVLMSQNISGQSDDVQFQFGNADRVMTKLANNTDLMYGSIDLCLYHVNSGILLQLWKGIIKGYSSDGSSVFPVSCSDGFFQIMNQYPKRQVSRQCWKTFDDGVNCPYSTQGSGGNPDSCDYYLESANGCQSHGMSRYFGGQQADPQGAFIKDDSTGFLGFQRNRVRRLNCTWLLDTQFAESDTRRVVVRFPRLLACHTAYLPK